MSNRNYLFTNQSTEHMDYLWLLYYGVNEAFNLSKDMTILKRTERVAYLSKLKNVYYEMYGNVLYKVSANALGQM